MHIMSCSNLAAIPSHNNIRESYPSNLKTPFQDHIFQSLKNVFHLYSTRWSYKIEKTTKISYRVIDLIGLFNGPLRKPYITLSSILKDITLAIESTNFFFVSYPLFVRDERGRTFFETRTKVQSAETLSLTCHLFLKMFVGAERARLLKLGIIGSYAIGNVPLFRYALESFILLFNFFGIWDGVRKLSSARKSLQVCETKIGKWNARNENSIKTYSAIAEKWPAQKLECKQRKWKLEQYNKHIDHTKACFKIAAKVSKFTLIIFAVTLMTLNVMTTTYLAIILNLGIVSDAIGLIGFMFSEYCAEIPPPVFEISTDFCKTVQRKKDSNLI